MSYYLILRNPTHHPDRWLENTEKVHQLLTEKFALECHEWEGKLFFSWNGSDDDEDGYIELSYELNPKTGRHEIWSDNPTPASAHIMWQIEQQLNDSTTLNTE